MIYTLNSIDKIVCLQIFYFFNYLRSYLHTDETAKKGEIWEADCKLCTLLLKAADENEKAHRYISKDVDFDLDKLMRNLNKE